MSSMKHIHFQKHGFTLVELLITMTIFSILGVLAFLNVKPYLYHARNTVRMDANAKIVLAVDAYLIQNRPILNITGTGAEVENAMIAGKNSTSDFYKSGIPNYNIFNWKKKDFYDPIFQQSYLL